MADREAETEPTRWERGRAARRESLRKLLEASILRVLARERRRPLALLHEQRTAVLLPFEDVIQGAVVALERVVASGRAETIAAVAEGLHSISPDPEMVDQAIEYGITGAVTKRDQ